MALNLPQTGLMRSVRGADEKCWRQARKANLTGTYRAFISNRYQHVYTIVHREDRNLPVGNLKVKSHNSAVGVKRCIQQSKTKRFNSRELKGAKLKDTK